MKRYIGLIVVVALVAAFLVPTAVQAATPRQTSIQEIRALRIENARLRHQLTVGWVAVDRFMDRLPRRYHRVAERIERRYAPRWLWRRLGIRTSSAIRR